MTETANKKPRTELSKAISKLNALRARRAKVDQLDREIAAQEAAVASLLGLKSSAAG